MTHDEILILAREAGLDCCMSVDIDSAAVLQFAALVTAAEREECAKACEAIEQDERRNWVPGSFYDVLRREAAAAIRARSQSGDKP